MYMYVWIYKHITTFLSLVDHSLFTCITMQVGYADTKLFEASKHPYYIPNLQQYESLFVCCIICSDG